MNFCPWCHKDLGDGKGVIAIGRHRRHCDFAPGTPWGGWRERITHWTARRTRMQGEAYANLARLLFLKLAPDSSQSSYRAAQERQLRQHLAEDQDAAGEIAQLFVKTPATQLTQDGFQRVAGLRAESAILSARLDELTTIKRFLESA